MDLRLTRLTLRTSLTSVLDLCLPRECVVCRRELLPGEAHICLPCLAELPRTHFAALECNPMAQMFNSALNLDTYRPFSYATALYYYREGSSYDRISQALKYHRDFGAGRFFASMLAAELSSSELYADVDLVTEVPLHWTRRLQRGYNQSEILAREIALKLGVGHKALLRRARRTRSQTRLRSPEDKLSNVSGAFAPLPGVGAISAKHILLVDDVFTSGSTLRACYEALCEVIGPCARVSIATLAFVQRN